MLGARRGMQVMAVVGGGAHHQHLPHLIGHERHRAAAGTYLRAARMPPPTGGTTSTIEPGWVAQSRGCSAGIGPS